MEGVRSPNLRVGGYTDPTVEEYPSTPLSIRQAIDKQVHAYLTHMERHGFWLGKNERRYDATP